MAQKIVLLHGLFMNGRLLSPLRRRLQAMGFDCKTFTYSTIFCSPQESAARLLPQIQQFAAGERLYFVGHSLGGIVIRHLQPLAPELFQDSRVITLGTPHLGSKVAAKMRPIFGFLINQPWKMGLDGKAPAWNPNIPLLSVAGTQPKGVGSLFRIFPPNQINDGTVLQTETELLAASEYQTIYASHTFMLYKKETAELIAQWFNKKWKPYEKS